MNASIKGQHGRSFIALLLFIFMATLGLFISSYQLYQQQSALLQNYQIQISQYAKFLAPSLAFADRQLANTTVEELAQDANIEQIAIVKADKSIMAASPRQMNINEAFQTPPSPWFNSFHWLSADISNQQQHYGRLYIKLVFDNSWQQAKQGFYLALFLSFAFSVLVGFSLARQRRQQQQNLIELNLTLQQMIDEIGFQAPHIQADQKQTLKHNFEHLLNEVRNRESQQAETVKQLEKRKNFAETIIETVQNSLVVVDRSLCIKMLNQAFYQLLNEQDDDMLDLFLPDILPTLKPHQKALEQVFNGEKATVTEQFSIYVAGKVKRVRFTATRLSLIGKASQLLLALEDITMEIKAARQTQLAAKMFQANRNAVLILDNQQLIQMSNPAMASLCQQKTLRHCHINDLFNQPEEQAKLQQILASNNTWQGSQVLTLNHEKIPFELHYTAIFSKKAEKEYSILQLVDLRDSVEMERLEKMALHDQLTGLPNRAHLMQRLQQTQNSHQHDQYQYCIAFLDLDGFKLINDTYGHDAGDSLLQQVSKRLQQNIRQSDLAARLAGDEFVLVLENTQSINDLQIFADKLLTVLTKTYHYGEIDFAVSASIGMVYIDHHNINMDISEQLKLADEAMYQAKQAGKNQVIIR
ncbi:diguanylate cyclase domain-containing protein [Motilimonas pumila]|uniref:Diguanylate cyclase n=1 Tax=Motilimonas pumila TaxID=2303987 RepID=A0A418YCS1_9GAMM|nr:diguanylate cyclase [Motilimonas pumila]RJG42298.1 diguanylate cyclase [Motilimonas pumila]